MEKQYPIYKYTEDDARKRLARFVRLDSPDSYPFDNFHAHEYNEILVFTNGGGNHNINFRNHVVENNSIHLLAAHDLHWLERSMLSAGFTIVYKDQFLQKLQMVNPDIAFHSFFSRSRVINLDEEQSQRFGFIFQELLNNQQETAYLLQLIGAFMTKIAGLDYKVNVTEKIYDPTIGEVIKLIGKHYRTMKTTAEYANILNVSTRTLHNRIKKASGMTLTAILRERILKEAKKLLVVSKMNVNEIALELGFNDPSHFTHWFKKQTGWLPSEYKYGGE